MVFCVICCVLCIAAVVICVGICNECRKDCEKYRDQWLKSEDRINELLGKWGETIRLCEEMEETGNTIIKCNENLIQANADLRLEIMKLINSIEEKENEKISSTADL